MKLHVPVTRAVPATFAAAAIALSLVLLPRGGASVRSVGDAPALRVAAAEVATAVQSPVRAVTRAHTRAHTKSVAPVAVGVKGTPERPYQPVFPRGRGSQTQTTPSKPVRTPAVSPPAATPSHSTPAPAELAHGKAKAWGLLRKIAALPPSASMTAPAALANDRGHAHGPPAIPPGHERGGPK